MKRYQRDRFNPLGRLHHAQYHCPGHRRRQLGRLGLYTVSGAGKDVKSVGGAVTSTAEDAKK